MVSLIMYRPLEPKSNNKYVLSAAVLVCNMSIYIDLDCLIHIEPSDKSTLINTSNNNVDRYIYWFNLECCCTNVYTTCMAYSITLVTFMTYNKSSIFIKIYSFVFG